MAYFLQPLQNHFSTPQITSCSLEELPGSHSLWHKPSWRRSPLTPLKSRQADNPQTEEQLYQRYSHTVKKVLGPTTDFPTLGSGKGTENPQGICLWRPVGFDYRIYTGLGKHFWRAQTKPCAPGFRRKEQWPHKRLTQTCLWVSRSLQKRPELATAWGRVGHWVQQCIQETFWRRSPLSSLPPPRCGLRSDNREGTQPSPSTENWVKDLLSMAPPIRTRLSLLHRQSLIRKFP